MKQIILSGIVLCVFASVPANAQIFDYPHNSDWNRQNNNVQYWQHDRMDQGHRDREHWDRQHVNDKEDSRGDHDNGNHYGQDPEHHKEGWKDKPKQHGKSDQKHRSKHSNKK